MINEDMNAESFIELGRQAKDEKRMCVAMFQDLDGNWRGMLSKNGKDVFVRDIGPETVLQLLLTHDGK